MKAFVVYDADGNIVSTAVPAQDLEQGDIEVEITPTQRKEGLEVAQIDLPAEEGGEAVFDAIARARSELKIDVATKKVVRPEG